MIWQIWIVGDVVAETEAFPVLVRDVPKHRVKDLEGAKVPVCVGDFFLVEHKGQQLGAKETAPGLELQFEIEGVAGSIGTVVGWTASECLEQVARGSDLSADL